MINALTIDVEDYFHVHAFSKVIDPTQWDSFDQRVERNTYQVLDLLNEASFQRSAVSDQQSAVISRTSDLRPLTSDYGLRTSDSNALALKAKSSESDKSCLISRSPKATFFVLGWVAQRFPSLVKEIHRRGHEIGCHGLNHKVIFQQSRSEFENDVRRAKELLEDIGRPPTLSRKKRCGHLRSSSKWASCTTRASFP